MFGDGGELFPGLTREGRDERWRVGRSRKMETEDEDEGRDTGSGGAKSVAQPRESPQGKPPGQQGLRRLDSTRSRVERHCI